MNDDFDYIGLDILLLRALKSMFIFTVCFFVLGIIYSCFLKLGFYGDKLEEAAVYVSNYTDTKHLIYILIYQLFCCAITLLAHKNIISRFFLNTVFYGMMFPFLIFILALFYYRLVMESKSIMMVFFAPNDVYKAMFLLVVLLLSLITQFVETKNVTIKSLNPVSLVATIPYYARFLPAVALFSSGVYLFCRYADKKFPLAVYNLKIFALAGSHEALAYFEKVAK